MFTVEIRENGIYLKSASYSEPLSILEIANSQNISIDDVVAYKLKCNYTNSNMIIDKDIKIDFVRSTCREGFRILQDTIIFVMMKAYYRMFSKSSKLVIEHSIGDGVYGETFSDHKLTFDDAEILKNEMQKIIKNALPIEKLKLSSDKAQEIFEKFGRDDIINNLTHRSIDIYRCEDYFDYYLRQLGENTNIIKDFDVIFHAPGLILRFPRRKKGIIVDEFHLSKNLFYAHQEHDKWLNILNVHNVTDLNRAIDNYKISKIIQIEEALHEKKIVKIAEEISRKKNIRIILIAGPSSSGKTTFAKRLSIQLRVNGIFPKVISMDDYFVSRNHTPIKENGEYDYESIEAIDLKLLNKHLTALLSGKEIELPKYNFITGMSENSHRKIKINENNVIIFEGIHGLNDRLTASVPFNQKVKIYVSALNNLNVDDHNRISTTDSRKIRRIIRDSNFRGHTAEQTLEMWDSVRDGEDVNIFPYQENADFTFNSILTYELGVLKKNIIPLLQSITCFSSQYYVAQRLIKLFNHINDIDEKFVPYNSILREFIGNSVFNY